MLYFITMETQRRIDLATLYRQAQTPEQAYDQLDMDTRLATEYAYTLEVAQEGIAAAGKIIRAEMLGAKDSTVTLLGGVVQGQPGYMCAAAAIERNDNLHGHYADNLRSERALELLQDMYRLNVVTKNNGLESILLKRPDGSELPRHSQDLTALERLKLDMFSDVAGYGGRYGRPLDIVGYNSSVVFDLNRVVRGNVDSDAMLPDHIAEELRDILPNALSFAEYKMYKWHYNPNSLKNTLAFIEGLTAIDPETVQGLDLTATAERLMVQAAALDYDAENAGALPEIQRIAMEREWTTDLLSRVCALQAWQHVNKAD